jgi:hypothetical protein
VNQLAGAFERIPRLTGISIALSDPLIERGVTINEPA